MQLAEELRAEPVWVINNGVAHADSVPTANIQPWVQVIQCSLKFEGLGFTAIYINTWAGFGYLS